MPLALATPDSVLVLHRGPDAAGARVSITRVDAAEGAVLWSAAELPIARLRHLLPGAADLVLIGDAPRPATAPGVAAPEPAQWLVFLDLDRGGAKTFNLAEASLADGPAPLE